MGASCDAAMRRWSLMLLVFTLLAAKASADLVPTDTFRFNETAGVATTCQTLGVVIFTTQSFLWAAKLPLTASSRFTAVPIPFVKPNERLFFCFSFREHIYLASIESLVYPYDVVAGDFEAAMDFTKTIPFGGMGAATVYHHAHIVYFTGLVCS